MKHNKIIIIVLVTIMILVTPLSCMSFKKVEKYTPFDYPKDEKFIQVETATILSDEQRNEVYDITKDPSHPFFDEKVKLLISNVGPKPNEQRINQYNLSVSNGALIRLPPTPEPTVEPTPEVSNTYQLKPSLFSLKLPVSDFYFTSSIPSTLFEKDVVPISWTYTSGRTATFNVYLSTNGGQDFVSIASSLQETSTSITLPSIESNHCIVRVEAMVGDVRYATINSSEFTIQPIPLQPFEIDYDFIAKNVQYTTNQNCHFNSDNKNPIWFKIEPTTEEVDHYTFQLSHVPFIGFQSSINQESGVIYELPLNKNQTEFSIELAKLIDEKTTVKSLPLKNNYNFYCRIVSYGKNNSILGDPGQGIQFSYGSGENVLSSFNQEQSIDFFSLVPYKDSYGKTKNKIVPLNNDVVYRSLDNTVEDYLILAEPQKSSSTISSAKKVVVQVSTSPFTFLDKETPKGLVYSFTDNEPIIGKSTDLGYSYLAGPYYNREHTINYKQFVPDKETLDKMGGIYYYVRALFYVPTDNETQIYSSKTMTIAYCVSDKSKNDTKSIQVRSDIPLVKFVCYSPIFFQMPDYEDYFTVTRPVNAEEFNFYLQNPKTGEFLLPYAKHIKKYNWTKEHYQEVLDRMLPVDSTMHFMRSTNGFWDEFISLLKQIYNGVRNAYEKAKTTVISVIDYLPIGEKAKNVLKKVARALIDYGLAYIGIPPNLPNFDVLAKRGSDYLVATLLEEAMNASGISANDPISKEISDQIKKEVGEKVSDYLTEAIISEKQNPFNVDYLRVANYGLYYPASVSIGIYNPSSTRMSRGGKVSISVTNKKGNSNYVYYSSVVTIPSLQPLQYMSIPVFLKDKSNQYPGFKKYFDEQYYSDDNILQVLAYFDLPDAHIEAKRQGIQPAKLPTISEYYYDKYKYSYDYRIPINPSKGIYHADDAVQFIEEDKAVINDLVKQFETNIIDSSKNLILQ